MPSIIEHIVNLGRGVGLLSATNVLLRRAFRFRKPVKVGPYNLLLRCCDSDMFVYGQIFGAKEYAVGKENETALKRFITRSVTSGKNPIIIDGGGNVGYSAVYFATTYPEASIITVEPDSETFAILKSNCSSFKNIVPVHGAIWTHENGVHLGNNAQASWARTVVDRGNTRSFTIDSLISKIPSADPFILKLDIEGAEVAVLRSSAATVKTFPCILIEPHDFLLPGQNSIAALYSILAERRIDTLIKGENLMFFDTLALGIGKTA
jgi:FkbM family methyltransferase